MRARGCRPPWVARVVVACIRKHFNIFNVLWKHGHRWNPDEIAL